MLSPVKMPKSKFCIIRREERRGGRQEGKDRLLTRGKPRVGDKGGTCTSCLAWRLELR